LLKARGMFFLTGLFFMSTFSMISSAAGQGRFFIKFATVAPEGSTWIKHMEALDRTLRENTGGRLGFRIYAGGIAGDELDVLKKIMIGQIHCAAFSGVGFGQILPMVRVLDLPFLFRNEEETDRVHKEMRAFFAEKFREKGFLLLDWAEVGNVHLFSKKPVNKVQDLAGLKVWAWAGDPIAKETFVAMGVNPIPLAITDVTTAMNTGMIDTIYAPPLGALALQWHRSVSYMMALPLVHSTGAILISLEFFKKLPPDLARVFTVNFDQTTRDLTAALRKQTREAVEAIRESKVTILPPPQGEDLKAFYAIHDKVAEKLTGVIYPREVLEMVYRILKRSS